MIGEFEARSCIDALESQVSVEGFVDNLVVAGIGRDIRVLRSAIQLANEAPVDDDHVRSVALKRALQRFGYLENDRQP